MKAKLDNLRHKIQVWMMSEEGQDLVEYALVVALIALGACAAMSQLGTGISQFFVTATTTIQAS